MQVRFELTPRMRSNSFAGCGLNPLDYCIIFSYLISVLNAPVYFLFVNFSEVATPHFTLVIAHRLHRYQGCAVLPEISNLVLRHS